VTAVKLFPVYKVLAYVVGVLLIGGSLASLAAHLLPEGTSLQQLGEHLTILWMPHGFIYIAYVVTAFLLAMRAGWTYTFLGLMLLAGLVPGLIFWVERRVEAKVRAEAPALVG
jgi:integral membrane protein